MPTLPLDGTEARLLIAAAAATVELSARHQRAGTVRGAIELR
jgi:hypothetical protein